MEGNSNNIVSTPKKIIQFCEIVIKTHEIGYSLQVHVKTDLRVDRSSEKIIDMPPEIKGIRIISFWPRKFNKIF